MVAKTRNNESRSANPEEPATRVIHRRKRSATAAPSTQLALQESEEESDVDVQPLPGTLSDRERSRKKRIQTFDDSSSPRRHSILHPRRNLALQSAIRQAALRRSSQFPSAFCPPTREQSSLVPAAGSVKVMRKSLQISRLRTGCHHCRGFSGSCALVESHYHSRASMALTLH
jgi:hypothetical protein